MLQIDFQSRTPIYEQLVSGVIRLKTLNILAPDEKLPSVRNLATELGINPNTVAKAYQMLESMGIIYSVNGKGSFISQSDGTGVILKTAETHFRDAVVEAANLGLTEKNLTNICRDVFLERGADS